MTVDQTELDKPTITREGRVQVAAPMGTNIAGWYGPIPERDALGFITSRHPNKHRLKALDAYALSLSVLDVLDTLEVEYVLIKEEKTGDTYEWKLDAIQYGDEVPEKFLDHPDDPQKYVPRKSARAVWREYDPANAPSVPEDAPGFERASDHDPDATDGYVALTPSQIQERGLDPSEVDEVISRDDPRHPSNSDDDADDTPGEVVATFGETTATAGEGADSEVTDAEGDAYETTGDDGDADSDDTDASDGDETIDDELAVLLDEFGAESLDDLTDEQRLKVASRRGGL